MGILRRKSAIVLAVALTVETSIPLNGIAFASTSIKSLGCQETTINHKSESADIATRSNGSQEGEAGDLKTTWDQETGVFTISGTGTISDILTEDLKNDVKNIVIEHGVTSIGNGAFSGCGNLTNITIPESVTSIGENAFFECSSLTTLTIPGSVTKISRYTFWGCSSLTSTLLH